MLGGIALEPMEDADRSRRPGEVGCFFPPWSPGQPSAVGGSPAGTNQPGASRSTPQPVNLRQRSGHISWRIWDRSSLLGGKSLIRRPSIRDPVLLPRTSVPVNATDSRVWRGQHRAAFTTACECNLSHHVCLLRSPRRIVVTGTSRSAF